MGSERKREEVAKTFFGSKTKTKTLIGVSRNSHFKWNRLRLTQILFNVLPCGGMARHPVKLYTLDAVRSLMMGGWDCIPWRARLTLTILKRIGSRADMRSAPRSGTTPLNGVFPARVATRLDADSIEHGSSVYRFTHTHVVR
jgi:hypothetical protein